jgi:MFS family permease
MGLMTGPLTDRGYLRPVMITGHLMVIFGMLMLSISTKYYQILLAQGFCVGIGAGAINIPAFALISAQFTTRRPIALGCASTGASIGGIVFPLMFRRLAPQVGFGPAVRAIALASAVMSVPTLLIYCRRPGVRSPTARMIVDPRGFAEPVFGTFVAALFFQFLAYYIPLFYLTTYAAVKLHTGIDFAFDLLAISNAASFFGRTVPYLFAGAGGRVTPIQILISWEAVGIALLFGWMAVTSVRAMVVWTVTWGFLSGVLVTAPAASTAHPTLSPSLDVIGARLGMSWSTAAVGVLIGAPIAGALADVAHADFMRAQVFAGVVMAVAVCLMTVPLLAAHRFEKRKADAGEED